MHDSSPTRRADCPCRARRFFWFLRSVIRPGWGRIAVCGWAGLTAGVLGLLGPAASAQTEFDQWLEALRRDALARGIRPATLDQALEGLAPIERVIELDRNQPEFKLTYQEYMDRVMPASRIERGRKLLRQHRDLIQPIARHYGVPAHVIVALWGIESDFGRIQGGFDVVPALVTLAHDERRSAYFRAELLDALQILDEGHVSPDSFVGSWAGAMGQCQFMPSTFRRHAVDQDGDGRRDIWGTRADVFASAANYLASSGWQPGYRWGRPVRLPAAFDRSLASLEIEKPLRAWQALGVRRADGGDLPAAPGLDASLIIHDDGEGPAFLVYPNFEVIMTWNRSKLFATAVGRLADQIAVASAGER